MPQCLHFNSNNVIHQFQRKSNAIPSVYCQCIFCTDRNSKMCMTFVHCTKTTKLIIQSRMRCYKTLHFHTKNLFEVKDESVLPCGWVFSSIFVSSQNHFLAQDYVGIVDFSAVLLFSSCRFITQGTCATLPRPLK